MTHEDILNHLRVQFGVDGFTTSEFRDNKRLIVAPAKLFEVFRFLKEQCGFDMLAELTAVDYLRYPDARDRFGVIYCLLNTETGARLFAKSYLNEFTAFPLRKDYPLRGRGERHNFPVITRADS